jgi:hypothetical protein
MTFQQFDDRMRKMAASRWAIVGVLVAGWGPALLIGLFFPLLAPWWDHDELAGLGFASGVVLGRFQSWSH